MPVCLLVLLTLLVVGWVMPRIIRFGWRASKLSSKISIRRIQAFSAAVLGFRSHTTEEFISEVWKGT